MDVWHWIEKNWPMLLAILLGPITAAAYFFWKFFGADIEKWVGDAIAWIKGAWNGLVGFFSGVIGSIGRIIGGIWHVASDAAGTVVATIKGAWNGLVDFFVGLPGRIGHPLSGMWSGFVDSFKGAINTFIGLWNSFHTPSVDILGVKTPSVGLPHINPLAAGGIVTGPTLALLGERGPEAVIPLNQARTGPAVVIQQASFATEMDVDLFMRRVAWSVQARAV